MPTIPRSGLTDAILRTIENLQKQRGEQPPLRLIGSLFTTFTFECEAFERWILPSLYGIEQANSRPARLHMLRVQLQETAVPIVFYDVHTAPDMGTQAERFYYVPVQLEQGRLQHSKHTILLLGDEDRSDVEYMILVTGSANLTKAGWYRNIEFIDIEVLKMGQAISPSLKDGLSFINAQIG